MGKAVKTLLIFASLMTTYLAQAQMWNIGGCATVGGQCDVTISQTGDLACGLQATISLSKAYQDPCAFHHPAHRWAKVTVPAGGRYIVTVTYDLTTYDYWNGSQYDVFYMNMGSQSFSGPNGLGAAMCGQTQSSIQQTSHTRWWGGDVQECPGTPCTMQGSFSDEYFDANAQGTIHLQVGLTTGVTRNSHGTFTVQIRRALGRATVAYRSFIHCEALRTSIWAAGTHDGYAGDNRWFTPVNGTARSTQRSGVAVDSFDSSNGALGTPLQLFGSTEGYPDLSLAACESCRRTAPPGPAYCRYCITGLPVCQMTAVNGTAGNVLTLTCTRVGPNEIKVDITLAGYNPCVAFTAPAIDAVFTMRFRQRCENGQLAPLEYKIDPGGMHDGFPWHELYVNDVMIYRYDPCLEHTDPFSLGGGLDVSMEAQDPLLTTWRLVPAS